MTKLDFAGTNKENTMLIWGAVWGLILGFLWPGHDSDAQAVVGAIAGAIPLAGVAFALSRQLNRTPTPGGPQ